MDFMLKEADILVVCSPAITLRQVSHILQQRHACLQGRSLFYRVSNKLKVSSADPLLIAEPPFCFVVGFVGDSTHA